jgi:histidinol dehydrogenase
MREIDWNQPITKQTVARLLPRANAVADLEAAVAKIIREVEGSGSKALIEHASKFDGVVPQEFRIPSSKLKTSLQQAPKGVIEAMEQSIARLRKVSQSHLPTDKSVEVGSGGQVDLRFVPFDSAGIYAPGGKAVYPSSVIMNAVPAQVAGVKRIVLCSPAQKEFGGDPHPLILAAAELVGIEEVYAIGGATAIAALAGGITEIGLEKVDLVTGPGNAYVATAKQLLRSKVAIDSEAGPTEILIIADEKANPSWIAADLISQAEHDESAAAVLLSDSSKLIEEVMEQIELQLANTPNRERVSTALSGEQSALVLVESISDAIAIANLYATEHLEIQTESPRDVLRRITNAGAVFLGDYSPVSLGDYLAGSNHVLPTSGQARRSSGLSVYTFLRQQQVVDFTAGALSEVSDLLTKFADAEGLPAHGEAARIRFSN